jgi:phytoene dehydrogenase-like protein
MAQTSAQEDAQTSAQENACDYVIVGSGINALVAAALLGKKGHRVLVLERNDRIGGCLRSEEITRPGFIHDVMATTCVLFITSPAYGELAGDLAAHGLAFADTDLPTGVLLPNGDYAVLSKDRARNIAMFDRQAPGDGTRFAADVDRVAADAPFLFSLLGGSLWSLAMAKTILREGWRRGFRQLATFFGAALMPARSWLESRFTSPVAQALFAPWVLHCGLGPETAYSGQMAKVIAFALEAAGAPIVKGGAQKLLDAFAALIGANGGKIRTSADVTEVLTDGNRATGVKLADGTIISAGKGVICSVTPNQLYGRLLGKTKTPPQILEQVSGYRYGKGNMQIHFALDKPPQWRSPELAKVALLHLTPGLDGVSKAANEAERGMLPAQPTVCVGQPTALDPSRAPDGSAILWIQLPEAPRRLKGDAAGEITVPADGAWTEAVRELYADRIEALLATHIDGFKDSILARKAYSPADLQNLNMNLEGGDPYGGYCGIDQFFLWRPLPGSVNHRTHLPGLYHIGASTHPGPGLAAGSGYLLAKSLR